MRQSSLILFMCAGLLLSGGAILGGASTWSLLRISYYFWVTDLAVELAGGALVVAGALLCLPACWLATLVPYHPKSQSLLATLLCVATAAMMVLSMGLVAAAGLTHALRSPAALNASMHHAMALEPFDPAVRSSFAAMQCDLRCCGVQSYTDWHKHRTGLPPSCCGHLRNGKHAEPCEAPMSATGCLRPAILELRGYANAIAALSSALIIILAVTVFAASYSMVSSSLERQKVQQTSHQMRLAFLAPDSGAPLAPAPRPAFVAMP